LSYAAQRCGAAGFETGTTGGAVAARRRGGPGGTDAGIANSVGAAQATGTVEPRGAVFCAAPQASASAAAPGHGEVPPSRCQAVVDRRKGGARIGLVGRQSGEF